MSSTCVRSPARAGALGLMSSVRSDSLPNLPAMAVKKAGAVVGLEAIHRQLNPFPHERVGLGPGDAERREVVGGLDMAVLGDLVLVEERDKAGFVVDEVVDVARQDAAIEHDALAVQDHVGPQGI